MKLLQRSSRYYLFFSLLIFAVIALALFYALRYSLNHTIDELLVNTRQPLARELSARPLSSRMEIMDEIVELQPISVLTNRQTFRDTLIEIYDIEEAELEFEPYRKYTYDALIDDIPYRISISLSTVENEDIIRTVLVVVIGGLLLFLLAINLLNRYLSIRLWKPFYGTVAEIKAFSARQSTAPAFPPSETDEFADLNQELERMTDQMQREYDSLRRFTENASHEIQTPLAIIRNHLDILLRTPDRPEQDYRNLQRISEAVSRLGKLNRTLLLLTKIEHDQFPDATHVEVSNLLREKLEQLTSTIADKGITVTTDLAPLTIFLPPALADVLLNNLLSNAIRHNQVGGMVLITLGGKQLIIENTGPTNQLADHKVFDRFRKDSTLGDSLGLGLALVKEICARYGYRIRYEQLEKSHRVSLQF
ncbi:HAMP domain-containing sensor histidine kinase [Lewinella sp. JB7]|uniref:sensor histidine kinase n=1 Tax=Lewinella sp. JB7 TaxID=2962887 RepID=UPI0020C97573|nr:HAMP domain-containing sensor histidine kinase [Lewinella sp. JB7]MCP9234726.1 HAMP domain-containing histidine kinase [Lewinella sp. JB7]